jgi:putative membrane-bound dehydrogenase-like protein
VIVSAEDEYKTEITLPKFAAEHLGKDFRVSFVFGHPIAKEAKGEAAKLRYTIPGLEVLDDADVLLVSVRRRPILKAELDRIRKYVASGKPIVGIRTASHPFHIRNQKIEGTDEWPDWDHQVIGGNYSNHHANNLRAWVWPLEGVKHPILEGIPAGELEIAGSLYVNTPLQKNTTELLRGKCEGIEQHEPVAWTFQRADGGKTFYTSLGHPDNFDSPVFQRLLLNGIKWAAGVESGESRVESQKVSAVSSVPQPSALSPQPSPLPVPGTWDSHRPELATYDGFAWYRCAVTPPANWKNRALYLYVEKVDNACETFFNGVKVGVSGTLPPKYTSGLATNEHRYVVPGNLVKPGEPNLVAIRVYDHDGKGGFKGRAPYLIGGNEAISLEGQWQFRLGDDEQWAKEPLTGFASFDKVGAPPKLTPFATVINRRAQDQPLSPQASRDLFRIPDDLEVELVLSEPTISQPLFMSFDERGRLWVLNYLQYPEPAGLTLISKDQWWRAVYDKVPEPPPKGVKGKDKITIHEDTDGDGQFDKHTTFLDGLNIATSFARGRGGVFVLNPPYLLFYADKNHDDVPDGDPEVLLSGFGLEDTHSVTNSLRWGPDGWLYAAQGSTVSANVKRPGDKTGVFSQGQNIWRYHPETRRYEIFCEGGGNAFSVEIDAAGRLFSGHNGGNTHGFHYVQGGYLQKGFSKHGALSNPYSFGYFPAMEHGNYARFTHNFLIYEGDSLPEKYQGKLFGVNPINSHVVLAEMTPVGSTFKTTDIGFAIDSEDKWFRPVDVKDGPDGNIYIADWYDGQLAHTANYQGGMDRERGRIYRIRAKHPVSRDAKSSERSAGMDLARLESKELIALLEHSNRWHRQTALRLIYDRKGLETAAAMAQAADAPTAKPRVDIVWGLFATGLAAFQGSDRLPDAILGSATVPPEARAWTIRILADENRLTPAFASFVANHAKKESSIHVLCQLAASAKRLPAEQALPIVRNLIARSEYIDDPRFPLQTWWALEAQVQPAREAVLALFHEKDLWREALVEKEILPRLMRRFAATGQRADLAVCAQLLKQSPSKEATAALMQGFEEAYKGRSLSNVPAELVEALSAAGGGSLALKIRQQDAAAIDEALKLLADEKAKPNKRSEYALLFGETKQPKALPVLLDVLDTTADDGLRTSALSALTAFNDPRIPAAVLKQYSQMTEDVRAVAQALLASRKAWALAFAQAVESGEIAKTSIPLETVRKLTIHHDDRLAALVQNLWGTVEGASTAEMQASLERLTGILATHAGDPYPGKKLYMQMCGKCHKLHDLGGQIGPDLTTFKRDDVRTILLNILNPSAEIREGFEMYAATTEDGRVVTGFLVEQDPQVVVLRTTVGETVSLERKDVDEFQRLKQSPMPEGQLKELTDDQVRDLFAYLRSAQPLND